MRKREILHGYQQLNKEDRLSLTVNLTVNMRITIGTVGISKCQRVVLRHRGNKQ